MTEIENKITNLLNPTQSYVVALSGGVDSSVLLHIVHSYTSNVRSVFVNHNQKDSDKLQKSAENFAKDLGIDHLNVDTQLDSDSSEQHRLKQLFLQMIIIIWLREETFLIMEAGH